MNYIDTHIHFDFFPKMEKIISAYEANGIYALFVTHLPEIYHLHFRKYKSLKYVKLALGYHPSMGLKYPLLKNLFIEGLNTTDYIGEIGLDTTNDKELNKYQDESFKYILENCKKHQLLSIHSRKAENRVFDYLLKYNIRNAIFHWYTGPLGLIDKIAQRGFYFSVNPKMLKGSNSTKILERIPLGNLLFETDAPFANFKNDNMFINESIKRTYDEFSKFYDIDFQKTVYLNFKNLLNYKENLKISNSINLEEN